MGITNTNTERFIGYDLNGNINWLQRWGDSSYEWLEFNFIYDGNRLVETAEWAYGEFGDYTYDLNGNLTSDNRKCLEYSWNILNLPDEVSDGIDVLGTYCYMADGSKYSVFDHDGNRRLYVGSFVFTEECGEIVEFSVDSGEGRVKADWNGGVWDLWFVRDHLGSVRCVVDLSASANAGPDDVILEQNDYLPYGTKVSSRSHAALGTNLYRYAGKEEQCFSSFDFQLLDFGARYYDPWSCQWTAVDPMSEKYYDISPYAYCAGDPVNLVDPDGNTIVIGSYLRQLCYSSGEKIPALKTEDSYVEKVSSHLEQLKEMNPELNKAVETIDNSFRPYLILPVSQRDAGEGNGYHALNNIIYYDPDNDVSPLPNEDRRDPKAGLAHELGHAQNDENGTRSPIVLRDVYDLNGERGPGKKEIAREKFNKNEANSIGLENIVREQLGLSLRSYDYLEGVK